MILMSFSISGLENGETIFPVVQVSPVLKIPTSQGYLAVALGCLLLALAAACSSVRVVLIGPERRFTLTYKET